MCIIAAKYFPELGWAGAKNRDRNYVPELSFEHLTDSQPHRLLMHDDMTGYMEGLNTAGICVLSASLQVMDDEKEITKRTTEDNPDGERIKDALKLTDIDKVVKQLVKEGMTGNTIIFNEDKCYLLEGCNKDDVYHHELEEILPTETVARTNHGILLPWAGYQTGVDSKQDLSRKSSDSRLKYAELALKQAQTPDELVDLLAQTPEQDTQMNPLRTTTDTKKMRTTAQELMVAKEHTFFLRPIQSKLDIDFWSINQNPDDAWVEILSNRIMRDKRAKDVVMREESDPYASLAKIYGAVQPDQIGKHTLTNLGKKYSKVL
jgi:hypothetical protein